MSRSTQKRLRSNSTIIKLVGLLSILFLASTNRDSPTKHLVFANAQTPNEDGDTDSDADILAEMLAEEQRNQEELEQLEAEMRELEELKAKRREQAAANNNKQGPNTNKKIDKNEKGGRKMPGGTNSKQFEDLQEQLRQKEAEEQESRRKADQKTNDQVEQQKKDEIARKREEAFQEELRKQKDEKQRKAMARQKTKDAKIVKGILKRFAKGDYYGVLGLRCRWGEFKLGPLRLCTVTPAQAKRSYRTVARLVHPDKNRDGRAEEAFHAVEESASILMDVKRKKEYDARLRRQWKDNIVKATHGVKRGLEAAMQGGSMAKKLLGPFATPIIILFLLGV